jgi:4-carboxymuconolactone decarboxylase
MHGIDPLRTINFSERNTPMRLPTICAGILGILSIVNAQAPTTRALNLRGDRFQPLTYDTMTPEQKKLVDSILSGERTSLDGPFNVLLRSPEMGDLAQKFGAQMRFHSSIPRKLNEFAILLTARHWTAQFEWQAHRKNALAAGLSPALIDAVAAGKRPASMQPEEEAVYNFCTEVLTTRQVSDAAFQALKDKFGERGVVDLMGVVGYYQLVSMLLNVDRYPLADGAPPELKPLH